MVAVSIIIPIYNMEQYLPKCLDSVLGQTLRDIEVICVDDGSADNSLNILQEYAQKDARIVVVMQENHGAGAARNNGLKRAVGEYVGFVDPDDWVEADMYETMYKAAKENNINVVQCNYVRHETNGKSRVVNIAKNMAKRGVHIEPNRAFNLQDVKKCCMRILPNFSGLRIYKRDFLEKNSIRFGRYKVSEDQVFSMKVKILTSIYYLEQPFYHYVNREGSLSNIIYDEHAEMLEDVAKIIEENNLTKYLQKEFDKYASSFYVGTYRMLDEEGQKRYLPECKKQLTKSQYKIFKSKVENNFFENIFSIKSKIVCNKKHKVMTILGKQIGLK